MAVGYGEVAFSLVDLRIASWNFDETYDASAQLDYMQQFEFGAQADTDMLKAFGFIVETLAVTTHAQGSFQTGAIDFDTYNILCGITPTTSGTTPNQSADLDIVAGGDGLPYFGLIGKLAGLQGSDVLVGFYKAKLQSIPGFRVEQNKFILPQTNVIMVANNQTDRKLVKIRRRETGSTIPTDFDTFFT